jgi:prepilin-type processing-associated H-X9-DG protein
MQQTPHLCSPGGLNALYADGHRVPDRQPPLVTLKQLVNRDDGTVIANQP